MDQTDFLTKKFSGQEEQAAMLLGMGKRYRKLELALSIIAALYQKPAEDSDEK